MSSAGATDPTQTLNSASKKKTNSKKKKNANKNKGTAQPVNGDVELGTNDTGENEPEPPTQASQDIPADDAMTDAGDERVDEVTSSNGHAVIPEKTTAEQSSDMEPATAKLDAMSKEREALRAEVEQLRRQLENIQQSHNEEVAQLQTNLDQTTSAKEEAEEQYQNLRERVEKIRESLTDRLQRDKAELDEAKERIEELTAENEELRGSKQSSGEDVEKLRQELQDATRELNTLRSRSNLSTQNWTREKDELTRTIQHLREEMVQASNAMGEWEVIAMEERSLKESLSDKIQELEEQVLTLKRNYENAAMERDSQATLVDNLQNALKEIQEARKKELREMVETTEAQLQAHKQAAQVADSRAAEAEAAKEVLAKEVERTAPFEKEVKEKNLLIGKLRHEAIVLNEHLTKALRYLKKTKPEDNVDRQIVTNHLLHFLTLDRSDVKRFQVLQVIAGYLDWTDEQREHAGLARPGTSGNSLRLPASPFYRTPSSPSLNADLFSEPASSKDKESLAELWAGFLERSAQEGASDAPPTARKQSSSSAGPAASKGPEERI